MGQRRKWIRWAMRADLVVEVALGVVDWAIATVSHASDLSLALLQQQPALLDTDIARSRQISKDLPTVEQ